MHQPPVLRGVHLNMIKQPLGLRGGEMEIYRLPNLHLNANAASRPEPRIRAYHPATEGPTVSQCGFDPPNTEIAISTHADSKVLETCPVLHLKLHDDRGQMAAWKFMPGSLGGMWPLSHPRISLELKSKHSLFLLEF